MALLVCFPSNGDFERLRAVDGAWAGETVIF